MYLCVLVVYTEDILKNTDLEYWILNTQHPQKKCVFPCTEKDILSIYWYVLLWPHWQCSLFNPIPAPRLGKMSKHTLNRGPHKLLQLLTCSVVAVVAAVAAAPVVAAAANTDLQHACGE